MAKKPVKPTSTSSAKPKKPEVKKPVTKATPKKKSVGKKSLPPSVRTASSGLNTSADPTVQDQNSDGLAQEGTNMIDVPRSEGEGVIRIPEPVDRPVHWTDVWKAENREKELEDGFKRYRCLSCMTIRTRKSVDELPAGDERCSHEWEEVQCQSTGSNQENAELLTTPLEKQESESVVSTASPTSSSLTPVATQVTSAVTTKPLTPAQKMEQMKTAPQNQPSLKDLFSGAAKPASFGQRVNEIKQERVIAASDTPPHLMIVARAGTGKTTTIVGGMKVLKNMDVEITPSDEQQAIWDVIKQSRYHKFCCFCALNSSIAEELARRVPVGVDAKTTHGIGFRAITKQFKLPNDAVKRGKHDRIPNIISELLSMDVRVIRQTWPSFIGLVENLIKLCQSNLVGYVEGNPLLNPDHEYWYQEIDNLVYQYDIEFEDLMVISGQDVRTMDVLTQLIPATLERLKNVNKDQMITFTDMIWLPVVLNLPMFKFDILFVDEAQDLNKCQHALIKRLGRRLILCGDPAQSIYGFAGADSDSIPRITEYLREQPQKLSELKLTVTRRCAKKIVLEANQEVPDFFAHPNNPEGSVSTLRYLLQPTRKPGGLPGSIELPIEQTFIPHVQPGDMILCRSIAPLVSVYFKLLKQGVPVILQGKDLAQSIINLITKMKATTVPALLGKVDDWVTQEITKEQAKRNPRESYMVGVREKQDCVKFFCEDEVDVTQVIKKIEKTFTSDEEAKDEKNKDVKVRCMTIHKAKGLESVRVFYLRPAVFPGRREDRMLPWQRQEEKNLRYVAKTRAIEELIYVV